MSTHDPYARFTALFEQAAVGESFEPTRAALATVDDASRPSVRFVLVREADHRGFVFFTDYRSKKACDLIANPVAALAWHWSSTGVQVRTEGAVERLNGDRSDTYFAARPRGSQLGAWASVQSAVIDSRKTLDDAVDVATKRFEGGDVSRPDHWGGYLLVPDRIEFWFNRDDRLHDREDYVRDGDVWTHRLLSP